MNRDYHLSIRMDRDTHDKIQYVAADEGRSMSSQIVYLMRENIRAFEKEHGPIPGDDPV